MNPDPADPIMQQQSLSTIASSGHVVETLVDSGRQHGEVGRYCLQHKLGSGGMGEVWTAEQQHPVKRQVAVKLIRADKTSQEIINRFNSERQALALMSHPNIAKILDAGTTPQGQPFFVMELVHGQSLNSYCDQHRLQLDQRLRLFREVCVGIQHAHQKGVIHRDLKPGNILVSEQDGKPAVKIIDFGLAKAIQSDLLAEYMTKHTHTGQILGTLKYMSPEQARMNDAAIDIRSDVYSLGIILYELLTGVTPADELLSQDRTPLSVLQSLYQSDPIRPSRRISSYAHGQRAEVANQRQTNQIRLEKELSGDLDWIVMKALELEPNRRYASVVELANDVDCYLNDEPIAARPPSIMYQLGKLARKYKTAFYASALVASALLMATGLSVFWAVKASQSEQQTEKSYRLLMSVFQDLDTQQASAGQASMIDLLVDRLKGVSEQVDANAFPDPATRAEMHTLIGNALLGFDQPEQALKSLQQALDVCLTNDDQPTIMSLDVMVSISTAYLDLEDFRQAAEINKEIQNTAAQLFPNGGREKLKYDAHVATVAVALNLEEGITLIEQAWKSLEKEYGELDGETLDVQNNYAIALQNRRKFDEAAKILEDVLEKRKRVLGLGHQDTLRTVQSLATQKLYLGDASGALELLEPAAAQAKKNLPTDHEVIFAINNNLGSALLQMGDTASAKEILQEVYAASSKKFGRQSEQAYTALNSIARIELDTGNPALAVQHYEEVRDAIENSDPGTESPNYLPILNSLVSAYERAGQLSLAIECLEENIDYRRQQRPPDEPQLYLALQRLGRFYVKQQDIRRSAECFEEVYRNAPLRPEFREAAIEWFSHYSSFATAQEIKEHLPELLNEMAARFGGDFVSLERQYLQVREILWQTGFRDIESWDADLLGIDCLPPE